MTKRLLTPVLLLGLCLFASVARAAITVNGTATSAAVLTQVGVVPTFANKTNTQTGAGGATSLTLARPSTTLNNVMIAQVAVRGIPAITAPAGWNLIDVRSSGTSGDEVTQGTYWRVIGTGEPASYTWSWDGTTRRAGGGILEFSNVETVNPVDVAGGQATNNSTTITAPGQTQTTANALLVALLASAYRTTQTTPAGMTQEYLQDTGAGPNGVTTSAYRQADATPGATGDRTSTAGDSSDSVAHLIVLRPKGALTIAVPTGTLLNDVMIATVAYRPCSSTSGAACTTTISPPAGWTQLNTLDHTTAGAADDGHGSRQFVYYRVATAAEPLSYTWYFGGTPVHSGAVGGMVSFTGVDTSSPIVTSGQQSTPTGFTGNSSAETPIINTGTVTNTMLVSSHVINSSGTWTPPGGMTERVDIASRAPNNVLGLSLEINTEPRAAAGSTGSRLATLSNPPTGDGGWAHMLALRPSSVGLHHLELQHASGTGLTCAASTLTIKACADSGSPCTAYTGGVTGTLTATSPPTTNWDGTTGGATGAGFVIAAGNSTVTKDFQLAAAGSVVFGTTSVSPAPGNATTCNFGSPSCTFTAATAGFIFSSSTTGGSYTIPAQTAGTATAANAIYLRAVQSSTTDPAVCTPAIVSQTGVAVTLGYTCNNPASCQSGNNLTVNSTAVPSGGGSVSMNFDANGSSPITLRYDDAGQITVNASKTITPFGGATAVTLAGNSNAFVVAPASFTLTPAGSPYVAGNSFSATVTAKNSLGNTTPNFGLETSPETVVLQAVAAATASATNSELVGPAGGVNGTLTAGAFALGNCAAPAAGTLCAANLAWTEVGDVKLAAARASGGYLGSTLAPFGVSATLTFKPAFLTTAFDTAQPCGGFTYSGQPFRIKVTAMRAANTTAFGMGDVAATTQNYTGTHARAVTLSGDDVTACATPATGFSNNTLAAADFTAAHPTTPGAASTAPVTNTVAPLPISYAKAIAAPTNVTVCASDSDGVTSHGQTQAVVVVRNGRLRLQNANGSELLPLPLTAVVQYYASDALAWQPSTGDSCSTLTATNFSFDFPVSPTNLLSACETKVTVGGSPPTPTVTLDAPGNNNTGWTDITVNLGTAAGNQCSATGGVGPAALSANKPWLQYDWQGAGATDPKARATFGVYRSGPVIHRREAY